MARRNRQHPQRTALSGSRRVGGGLTRRQWLQRMGAFAAVAAVGPALWLRPRAAAAARGAGGLLGFEPLAPWFEDEIKLAAGYQHQVFFPWGAAVDGSSTELRVAATAADQQRQAGMSHDGMAYFPIDGHWNPATRLLEGSSDHGWLVMNHEYTDEGLLHADGIEHWSDPGSVGPAKVAKSKAAQGVSVLEIERKGAAWSIRGGRRISGLDAIEVRGPARGHALLQTKGDLGTAAERAGTEVEGTFANCANGQTPWGTYLTCEENFQDYFARSLPLPDAAAAAEKRMKRYGIGATKPYVKGWRTVYGWDAHDARFDADRAEQANHCHRFGWVVEIDPADPNRRPAKRTALGRFSHENAAVVVAPDGRVVVYMGDDKRFEHIYKFVSKEKFEPVVPTDDAATRAAKRERHWKLLDEGKLYVACLPGDGLADKNGERPGQWVELSPAHEKLAGGFRDQAEVVVFAREAATRVGATKMDRPEWIAVRHATAPGLVEGVYVTLSNNDKRGAPDEEGATPANPRTKNVYGHLLRWREAEDDPSAATLQWKVLVQCGWKGHATKEQQGDIRGALGRDDQDFGSPDGLFTDPRGILWVQTDANVKHIAGPDYAKLGNNQMLAVDPETLEVRRFLVGPKGCEVTGLTMTPDARTMFVNIQHPGEVAEAFNDPTMPCAVSAWPGKAGGGGDARPRSATLIITHVDGKSIGT